MKQNLKQKPLQSERLRDLAS